MKGFKNAEEVYCPCSSEWLTKNELGDHLDDIGLECEGTHNKYSVVNKQQDGSSDVIIVPIENTSAKK